MVEITVGKVHMLTKSFLSLCSDSAATGEPDLPDSGTVVTGSWGERLWR